ncbi:histone acetyltransferase 1 [Peltigera leucophlebia]|nr:histone acetyltransferase 1 [Peltigera leucophlebia]
MAELEEWSSDSNQAVEISIVQAGQESPKTLSTFHPKFTYPIFGDQESIFGYQGLRIVIRFAAHDLRSNIQITHDKRFEAVGDTKATDIEETLKDWIPSSKPLLFLRFYSVKRLNDEFTAAFRSATHFDTHLQNSSGKDFKPPGYLIESYTSRNRNFEIWNGELTDPAVKELVERMQIFVSFFVEGGRPLDLGEEEWTLSRWRVFFV